MLYKNIQYITNNGYHLEEIKVIDLKYDQYIGLHLNPDLDDEIEEVTFSFSRNKKNEMSYIYKVASSKAKDEKSIQAMLDKMVGAIITLNDSFRVKE